MDACFHAIAQVPPDLFGAACCLCSADRAAAKSVRSLSFARKWSGRGSRDVPAQPSEQVSCHGLTFTSLR